jgi:hypothetical protein
MEPTLKMNQVRSNDKNSLCYRITVTQGAEIITSDDLLLEYLKGTPPYKKGITDVSRVSANLWEIKSNK